MSALQKVRAIGGMSLVRNRVNRLKSKNVAGVEFPNPLGLAAGFDKNAQYIDPLADLGFGFIEIGTVTPLAQDGNPKPRLFRLPKDEALLNRMGFNNGGLERVIENLRKRKTKIPIGGNIGKNKVTPNENAQDDYLRAFDELYSFVDYFVVNVSSPNTPNLRELQDKEPLKKLLELLQTANASKENPKPIFLKMAPDLNSYQIDDIIQICLEAEIDGVVATNTTIERNLPSYSAEYLEELGAGGISGRPLTTVSHEKIKYIAEKSQGKLAIIAVGGIFDAEDAQRMLEAGADLVQIYTGLIYRGPKLVSDILNNIKY